MVVLAATVPACSGDGGGSAGTDTDAATSGASTGPNGGTSGAASTQPSDTLDDDGDSSGSTTPPDLPTPKEPVTTVSESLLPFDVNREDLAGPGDWATNYGKSPEIIAVPQDDGIAIYAQNYDTEGTPKSALMRLDPSVDDYVITAFVEPPFLDRVMGLDHNGAGTLFVASGIVDDEIDATYPGIGEYRPGIVSVVSTDWDGTVNYDVDMDLAREAFAQAGSSDGPELVVNPMVAATSRLAFGGGHLALVHGINTDPDPDLDGTRHQKALTTHLEAATGAIARTSSMWVSHSFDQRVLFDGANFVEMHLGDAFPRTIVFGRVAPGAPNGDSPGLPLFHIKGGLGDNVTRTQIGDVALIDDDPTYGYLALFVAEHNADVGDNIAGTRELAVVRVSKNLRSAPDSNALPHLDPNLPDTLDVMSSGAMQTNRLRWLTDYNTEGEAMAMVERAKLVAADDGQFVAMWERHERNAESYAFAGTFAMTLDGNGEAVAGPTQISDSRLPRGDDAFALEGGAAFITGDSELKQLQLHLVDTALQTRVVVIE